MTTENLSVGNPSNDTTLLEVKNNINSESVASTDSTTTPDAQTDSASVAAKTSLPKAGDNISSRSFFGTLNNPEKYLDITGTPQEIADYTCDLLVKGHEDERSVVVSYCLAPTTETPHLHYGLYSVTSMRLKAVRELLPHADNQVAKGTKRDIEGYIRKEGKYAEKGEKVLAVATYGCFKGVEAARGRFAEMASYIEVGLVPEEVCLIDPRFFQNRQALEQMFSDKIRRELPSVKDMEVTFHVGEPGSGKSYTQKLLHDLFGKDLYVVTDYKHGFDMYRKEPIIFLDEFKAEEVNFGALLQWLDIYPNQVSCRYANKFMAWTRVHVATVIPPEVLVEDLKGVQENKETAWKELRRRIHFICYHWKINGGFYSVTLPMDAYSMYPFLVSDVARTVPFAVLSAAGCALEECAALIASVRSAASSLEDYALPEPLVPGAVISSSKSEEAWAPDSSLLSKVQTALFSDNAALKLALLTLYHFRLVNDSPELPHIARQTFLFDDLEKGLASRLGNLNTQEAALLLRAFTRWNERLERMTPDDQNKVCASVFAAVVCSVDLSDQYPELVPFLEELIRPAARVATCEQMTFMADKEGKGHENF